MILRLLTLVLVLGGSLTSPLFASTERGDHLFQEAGGVTGIPGVAGPAGAPGLAGAAGAAGIQGIPGIPGAPGVLDFSDFFALQGTDNSAIGSGTAVHFPRTGSTTGTILATGPSTFVLPTIGTYLVEFQVLATAVGTPAQLQLRLNGVPLPETVVGRATGGTQIIGINLVTTTTSGSVLEVIIPAANPGIVAPPTNAGIGADPISAHLVIVRLQ